MKKVALVTGGSRGIGFGIAQCLAREGFALAICGVREEKEIIKALKALRNCGTDVFYSQTDVSKANERKRLLKEIEEHFGHINVLINNAGVAPGERRDLLDASEQSFETVLRTNLQGPYFLTQSVARMMIAHKNKMSEFSCCIINIGSISATAASPNRGEYCVSKAGLSMATQLWAVRLAEFDIPVFEIRPGIVKTDMTHSAKDKYDSLIEDGLLLQPRWGTPEDVGKAVAMLVRNELPYSTGQVIVVDGGFTVQRL